MTTNGSISGLQGACQTEYVAYPGTQILMERSIWSWWHDFGREDANTLASSYWWGSSYWYDSVLQLERHEQRIARNAVINARIDQAPVPLATVLALPVHEQEYRHVQIVCFRFRQTNNSVA
jgi:hypothetical protein